MSRWLNGPLAGLDTETTGVDLEADRIVTACVGYARQPGDWNPRTWLVNPGIPIPLEATAIHGVTDAQATADGITPQDGLRQIVDALYLAWSTGAPVIGHNVVYDLTILDREARRHLGDRLEIAGPVIDTLILDKHTDQYRKGSRKLVDTCRVYNIPLGSDAHTADGDCFAAVRLAWAITTRHGMSNVSLDELHQMQIGWYADQRASLLAYLRRRGDQPADFNTVWPVAPTSTTEKAVA